MHKPSARVAKIAVAALAIPLFGGFATYAAAQVSTKPAPQVVIPGGPGSDHKGSATHTTVTTVTTGHDANDDKGGATVTTVSHDPAGHNANDDKGHDVTPSTVSDDPAGHDASGDNGGTTPSTVSDDPAGHDANDDNAGTTQTTVSDDPAGHDANDDKGQDAVTPGTVTTPTTVDDHGGQKSGSGRHGSDG
jgi:hypothetical protein